MQVLAVAASGAQSTRRVNAFRSSPASLTDERRIPIPIGGVRDPDQRDAATIAESQEMNTKMARLEQVDRLLNLVDELPLGHPDRLKFLTYAEEIIAGAVPKEEAGAPAPMNSRAGFDTNDEAKSP
jgi:hypothetical protein